MADFEDKTREELKSEYERVWKISFDRRNRRTTWTDVLIALWVVSGLLVLMTGVTRILLAGIVNMGLLEIFALAYGGPAVWYWYETDKKEKNVESLLHLLEEEMNKPLRRRDE